MSGPVVTAIHDAVCCLPITRVAASLASNLAGGGADPSGAAADQGNFACNTHGLPRFGWLAVGGNYSRQSRYHRDRQVITLLGLIPHNCLRSQIGLRGQK